MFTWVLPGQQKQLALHHLVRCFLTCSCWPALLWSSTLALFLSTEITSTVLHIHDWVLFPHWNLTSQSLQKHSICRLCVFRIADPEQNSWQYMWHTMMVPPAGRTQILYAEACLELKCNADPPAFTPFKVWQTFSCMLDGCIWKWLSVGPYKFNFFMLVLFQKMHHRHAEFSPLKHLLSHVCLQNAEWHVHPYFSAQSFIQDNLCAGSNRVT